MDARDKGPSLAPYLRLFLPPVFLVPCRSCDPSFSCFLPILLFGRLLCAWRSSPCRLCMRRPFRPAYGSGCRLMNCGRQCPRLNVYSGRSGSPAGCWEAGKRRRFRWQVWRSSRHSSLLVRNSSASSSSHPRRPFPMAARQHLPNWSGGAARLSAANSHRTILAPHMRHGRAPTPMCTCSTCAMHAARACGSSTRRGKSATAANSEGEAAQAAVSMPRCSMNATTSATPVWVLRLVIT